MGDLILASPNKVARRRLCLRILHPMRHSGFDCCRKLSLPPPYTAGVAWCVFVFHALRLRGNRTLAPIPAPLVQLFSSPPSPGAVLRWQFATASAWCDHVDAVPEL